MEKEPRSVNKALKGMISTIHNQRALLGKSVTFSARSLCVEPEEGESVAYHKTSTGGARKITSRPPSPVDWVRRDEFN